jgi:hypothetical protein
MSCPYLHHVSMSFCSAFPVRKLVPTERMVTESACEGEAFDACPVFRDLRARGAEAARRAPEESHAATVKEGGRS